MNASSQRRSEWQQRYGARRTDWDRGRPSPALAYWLNSDVVPQGRVLVPGCGHGHEVGELIRAGREVTAVDIAGQPVRRLREQLAAQRLDAQVIQADLLDWQPDCAFDVVYEQTCLCAIDPAQWAAYEQRLVQWLRPGGTLLALFMQTGGEGGPPFDCPLPAMRELFDDARWRWQAEPALPVPHPTGLIEQGCVLLRR